MDKSKIYTAEMAARAMADQILRGNRYAERFHIEVPEGIERIDDYAFDNLFVMNISLPSTLRDRRLCFQEHAVSQPYLSS